MSVYGGDDVDGGGHVDPMTGEPIEPPDEQWLDEHGVWPYYAGHFQLSRYYETFNVVSGEAPDLDSPVDMGVSRIVGLEFRHADGQRLTVLLPVEATIHFCETILREVRNG